MSNNIKSNSITKRILKLFSKDEKFIKSLDFYVKQINDLEDSISKLSSKALKAKTKEFKERISKGESLDSLLVEAFAVVREASKRTLGHRHFDVQLKGGIVLHRGMIAEMKTGEGKTLVATLPVYLNALSGNGVHVITVNDYLAQRDSKEMGQIYKALGLSVGCITNNLNDKQRKKAYDADITYGTNNEYGFDYLRDNMKFSKKDMCQRGLNFALIDEVDSVLIDEARTPLIISGPAEESSDLYILVNKIIPLLKPEDYEKDEKSKNISLTEDGNAHIEEILKIENMMHGDKLYVAENSLLVHHINQALKAHIMYIKDIDYIVSDDHEVLIIDEFTGRVLSGRRYSDGLHQAIEAKEHVNVEIENHTLASITFQNYFTMYNRLCGMTGTAITERNEFNEIYKLQTIEIPTNNPMIRDDMDDEIFRTYDEKIDAVVKAVIEAKKQKQPILVGTVSIEKSELFSKAFKKAGIKHQVLNARNHEKEAHIIAKAGFPGAVTIATNMAGRGTDIKLGGNFDMEFAEQTNGIEDEEEIHKISENIKKNIEKNRAIAKKSGGLFVIGTERHDSRRVDNQLRGRSGRQGDPGRSKFFISLQDDLMRIFGPNIQLLDKWFSKMDESDGPIKHPWITKSIEKAQQRVEAQNFDTRKHLLKYSNVLNEQRKSVYEKRLEMIEKDDLQHEIEQMIEEILSHAIEEYTNEKTLPDSWDISSLEKMFRRVFAIDINLLETMNNNGLSRSTLKQHIIDLVMNKIINNTKEADPEEIAKFQKTLIIKNLDSVWKEHINRIDNLRHGVHLQSYGQKDPLNVYKHEGFIMFKAMLAEWRENTISFLCNFKPTIDDDIEEASLMLEDDDFSEMQLLHPEAKSALEANQYDANYDNDFSNLFSDLNKDSKPKKTRKRKINKTSDEDLHNILSDDFLNFLQGKKEDMQKDKSRKNQSKKDPINANAKTNEYMHANISRNADCPCGSGLRYKHCHGKI